MSWRTAAQTLHGIEEETPSINAELLQDIKAAFERRNASRLATALLIEQLTEDDEAPWATWNRGRPMTARQLAHRLSEFGIKSKNMRTTDGVVKGYDLTDFNETFHRYLSLSAENHVLSATPLQPHNGAGLSVNGSKNANRYIENQPPHATGANVARSGSHEDVANGVADRDASQTSPLSHCSGVADVAPLFGKKEEAGEKSGVEVLDL